MSMWCDYNCHLKVTSVKCRKAITFVWTFLLWDIKVNGRECCGKASAMEMGTKWRRVKAHKRRVVVVAGRSRAGTCALGTNTQPIASPLTYTHACNIHTHCIQHTYTNTYMSCGIFSSVCSCSCRWHLFPSRVPTQSIGTALSITIVPVSAPVPASPPLPPSSSSPSSPGSQYLLTFTGRVQKYDMLHFVYILGIEILEM